MGFTQFPSGTPLYPSNTSYLAFDLTANVNLTWPSQQVGGNNIVAAIIDINSASGPGLALIMPDARVAGNGSAVLFNNVSAESVEIRDATGNTIATVAPGTAWELYLRDNTTEAGLWRTFQFGAGSSTPIAASLVGYGIKAIGSTLNQSVPFQSKSSDYTVQVTDRASILNWSSGVGVYTLPDPAVLGSDWFCMVRNSGSGSLSLTPDSGTIDGDSTLLVSPGESCIVITDGVNYYTVGFGQSSNSIFDYTSLDVSGTGDFVLSGAQLNRISYNLTGTLTGNRNIIVPATVQQYWIQNNTGVSAYTLTVKTPAGTGIVVERGTAAILFCNGTNVINATSVVAPVSSTTSPVPAGPGYTGGTTALVCATNNNVGTMFLQILAATATDSSILWLGAVPTGCRPNGVRRGFGMVTVDGTAYAAYLEIQANGNMTLARMDGASLAGILSAYICFGYPIR